MNTEIRNAGTRNVWDRIERVLWWCFGFSILFVLLWMGVLLSARDWLCRLHGRLFGLSPSNLLFANYLLIGWFKISACLFFLFPAIALRITRKRRA